MTVVDKSYFYKGNSTGILLIHGLGGTPVEMRYIAQGLHRAGYTVYCCQLEGHCGSIDDLKKTHWKHWTFSAQKALDKLSHCDNVFVGGLSVGSLIALYLADFFPEKIDGLLLYSPTLVLNGWAMPFYMKWLHYLRPSMILFDIYMKERQPHGIKDERIRAMIVDSMKKDSKDVGTFKTPISVMSKFNAFSAYMRKRLKYIDVPLLTIHSRDDDFAHISNSYEIISKVSSKSELFVLNNSYHIITLDKQRDLVLKRSQEYVESIMEMNAIEKEKRVLQYRSRNSIG